MLPLILAITVALFGSSSAQITKDANFLKDVTCTQGSKPSECATARSICAKNVNGLFLCACDEPNGYENVGEVCVKTSGLGDVCQDNENSACPTNSACSDAGDNSGQKRCKCTTGFVKVNSDPSDLTTATICGILQTTSNNPLCTTCESNKGICFKTADADITILCQCQSFRNGADCENSFVSVECDLNEKIMSVCYTVQPGFDFTTTASMYTSGFGNDPQCIGTVGGGACKDPAQIGLNISLNDADMARCGTYLESTDINSKGYRNTILITKAEDSQPPVDMISFQPFCSYNSLVNERFDPIGVGSQNGNDRGQHIEPDLTLKVLDSFLDPIKEGVAVKVGDTIFFEITLDTTSNTYMAFSVQSCTLSNKPNLFAKDAFTRTLIYDSCPSLGQSVFTNDNVFFRVDYDPAVLRTGQVTVFSVPVDGSIFIHCKLKMCLQNVTECIPENCNEEAAAEGVEEDQGADANNGGGEGEPGNGPNANPGGDTPAEDPEAPQGGAEGNRRKKRAVSNTDEDANISRELIIEDPSRAGAVVMSSTTFAVMISVLVLILLLFIVITVLLYLRLRRNQPVTDKVGDTVFMTQKPQRFAMPRVDRSQVRM